MIVQLNSGRELVSCTIATNRRDWLDRNRCLAQQLLGHAVALCPTCAYMLAWTSQRERDVERMAIARPRPNGFELWEVEVPRAR